MVFSSLFFSFAGSALYDGAADPELPEKSRRAENPNGRESIGAYREISDPRLHGEQRLHQQLLASSLRQAQDLFSRRIRAAAHASLQ